MDKIQNLAKASTPVTLYDVNNAIIEIKSYVSHFIQDVQQKKLRHNASSQNQITLDVYDAHCFENKQGK